MAFFVLLVFSCFAFCITEEWVKSLPIVQHGFGRVFLMPILVVVGTSSLVIFLLDLIATQWFVSLPIVTRYWFGGACLVTLAGNFGFISIQHFVFSHQLILQKLELWRIVTCFLYAGPFSITMVTMMYVLVTASQAYEQGGPFNTVAGGRTADYITALLFAMGLILIGQVFIYPTTPLFLDHLVFFVLSIWNRRNPTLDVDEVPTNALYLPFFILGLAVVTGNDPRPVIEGFAIGHLFYFLVDRAPVVYGRTILQTPQFLIDQFGTIGTWFQRGQHLPVLETNNKGARNCDNGGWCIQPGFRGALTSTEMVETSWR